MDKICDIRTLMQKICTIHIGSAKTGSTSSQKILHDNRDTLLANGIIYPNSCLWKGDFSHNTIGIHMWDNFYENFKKTPYSEIIENLIGEIESYDRAIISCELLEKAPDHGNRSNIDTLLHALGDAGFTCDVIYIIRRHDLFLESLFKHAVSEPFTRYSGTVPDFIKSKSSFIQYGKFCNTWKSLPNVRSIKVLPFIEGDPRSNIINFLSEIGILGLLGDSVSVPVLNPSLEGLYLRLKHWINCHNNDISLHRNYLNSVFENIIKEVSPPKTVIFSKEERLDFMKKNTHDLNILFNDFQVDKNFGNIASKQAHTEYFTPLPPGDVDGAISIVERWDPELARRLGDISASVN